MDIPEWYNHHSNLLPRASVIFRYANGTNDTLKMTYTNKYHPEDPKKINATLEFPPTGGWSNWREVAITENFGPSIATSLSRNGDTLLPLINSVSITWFQNCPGDCYMGPISIVDSIPNLCPDQATRIIPTRHRTRDVKDSYRVLLRLSLAFPIITFKSYIRRQTQQQRSQIKHTSIGKNAGDQLMFGHFAGEQCDKYGFQNT